MPGEGWAGLSRTGSAVRSGGRRSRLGGPADGGLLSFEGGAQPLFPGGSGARHLSCLDPLLYQDPGHVLTVRDS